MTHRAGREKWCSEHLTNILDTVIDYRGLSVPKSEFGVPLITARNVREGTLDFTAREFIKETAYDAWAQRGLPKSGDVLFTTEAPLGNVALFPISGRFAIGQRVVALRPLSEVIDAGYLLQFLLSPIGKKRIDLFSTGSTAKGISSKQLHKLVIDFPPIAHQQIISSALGHWDVAIEKTERLIAAKERYYTHELSRLISLGHHSRSHVSAFVYEVSERNPGGNDARVLSVTNSRGFVLPEDQFERRVASADLSNYKVVKHGQYAYNPSRINVGSIARLNDWDDGVLSPMYVVFGLDEAKVDSDYFLHWLDSHEARERIKKSAQGSVRETVSFTEFSAISIPLPNPGKQAAIARYLSELREEISTLNAYAEKLRTQKRGLMQKLLTGIWRVRNTKETVRS